MSLPSSHVDNYHTHQGNIIMSKGKNGADPPSSVNTSTSTLSQSLNGLNFLSSPTINNNHDNNNLDNNQRSLSSAKDPNSNSGAILDDQDIEAMRKQSGLGRKPSLTSLGSRGGWGNKWEFLLSCVGLSVGIGNVWRFPYLAYENGGGAFLIPYLVMLFLAGKPMYFMELALGQFGGTGPVTIWKCAPIMKGVGAAMVASSIVVCIYYNVVMSYAIYFIGQTFQSQLPWTRCDLDWAIGTNCVVRSSNNSASLAPGGKPAAQVFWERKVLDISDGIEDIGGIKWDLALCLFISWVIVIACVAKGVKSSGKVVYFAATFPYVVLLTLLVTGLMQEGAWEGVKFFIYPDFSKLLTIKVWQAAAGQMFFSLSVAMGGLIMYSSFNDFRHDIFRDAMVVSVLDTVTSIISGLVIFSVLGAMSHELGLPVKDVVKGGPGLAFIAYPEALAKLPVPQLWSILFFFMLFLLGLDSEFALLENILTSISDEVPYLRKHKLVFTIVTGMTFFGAGLICVTRGGQYVFTILDDYGGSIPLVFLAVFECAGLMWVYGFDKFRFDIYYMLERKMGLYWKITWKYTSPIILAFICIMSMVEHTPLKYEAYDFPEWADIMGWCLTATIIGQIPIWALYAVVKQRKGDNLWQKIKLAATETDTWGPRNELIRKDWRTKKTGLYGVNIIAKGVSLDTESFSGAKEGATLKRFTRIGNQTLSHDSSTAAIVNPGFEPESV